MICSLQSRHLKNENFEGSFSMSKKIVDLDLLELIFAKYETVRRWVNRYTGRK